MTVRKNVSGAMTITTCWPIASGSVTHRDLFLENSIKLPLLNVDLSLVGFFVVAPSLLVIFHFYLFLQLRGLASKAKDYNTLLVDEAPAASDRRYLRQQNSPMLKRPGKWPIPTRSSR